MAAEDKSIRDELEAAMAGEEDSAVETEKLEAPHDKSTEEITQNETPEQKTARERDEKGRFVAKSEPETPEQPAEVGAPEQGAKPEETLEKPAKVPAPPNGWSAEAKAKWAELPPDIQSAVAQREADVAKGFGKRDEHASFGKEMYQTIQPYLPIIQAEGGTPASAVKQLLDTAYILRAGTTDQKRQALLTVASQYGIDLTPRQGPQTQLPPEVQRYMAPVLQRVHSLESALSEREQRERTAQEQSIQDEISAFAAAEGHEHFEEVKPIMGALLRAGSVKTLQEAYDRAVWADPQVRATLEAQRAAEKEQKRREEAQRKASEAKRKAISLTGSPGPANSGAAGDKSLREELEAAMAASTEAV